jgi:hypothetical protein
VGVEPLRAAVVGRRMHDTQIRVQLEREGIEAKRQSLPDRFQRCFLEAPESVEGPQALRTR